MEPIDRVSLTQRPQAQRVMLQEWYDLLFLHWKVEPTQLRALLPSELELDTFEGEAYVGLVPFTMRGVRPLGFPKFAPLTDFHETNVRTYVHYQGRDPGVWFFSLDAANALAVQVARRFFKLPYYHAKMEMQITETDNRRVVDYQTERFGKKGIGLQVRYQPKGAVQPATVGSLEHFIAERYLLYAHDGKQLYSGRVYHTPYPLQTAEISGLQESMVAAAGIIHPDSPPLCHYARGVKVDIFPLQKVK